MQAVLPMFRSLLAIFLIAATVVFTAAPVSVHAHPDEDELIRQLQEQYGRPRPAQDPDRDQPPADEQVEEEPAAFWPTVGNYIVIGFQHILPRGLDHILFVFGLFFASTRFRPLLIQVSSFTVAHTATLALAILGYVNIPGSIVEPLIALSIAAVAVENIFFKNMTPWRPVVVFGFGLLHGLGFAGVLTEIGMPQGQFITGLISFNVGVELGQLTILIAAWAVLHWFYQRNWYRAAITIPASALIAAVGLYWTVERVFF